MSLPTSPGSDEPSLSDHPSRAAMEQWLAGQLAPETFFALEAHLSACSSCAQQLAALRSASLGTPIEALGAMMTREKWPLPFSDPRAPLSFERLAAYVDGTMTPAQREEFERELARRPDWQTEVADLRAFQQELAASPVAAPSAAELVANDTQAVPEGAVVAPPMRVQMASSSDTEKPRVAWW